jgi:threonyl-tRNA synthetase
VIENGFYYDMKLPRQLEPADLEKIEAEMKKAAGEDFKVTRTEMHRPDALAWADERHDPFKRELIEGFPPADAITFYSQGEFTDLCTGPHVPSPAGSNTSSCSRSRAPIGAATRSGRCCSASTAPRSSTRSRSKST